MLWFLVIGLIAGWLTKVFMKVQGVNMMSDLLIGVVGAVCGGWIFRLMGLAAYSFTGALLMAGVGAIALLVFVNVLKKT